MLCVVTNVRWFHFCVLFRGGEAWIGRILIRGSSQDQLVLSGRIWNYWSGASRALVIGGEAGSIHAILVWVGDVGVDGGGVVSGVEAIQAPDVANTAFQDLIVVYGWWRWDLLQWGQGRGGVC